MIVEFTIGDWSGDGHGHKEHYHADISGFFNLGQVKDAYDKGKADLGFGIEDIANQYDSTIADEQTRILMEDGFDPLFGESLWFDMEEGDNLIAYLGMDEEMYLAIFKHIVQKYMPDFEAVIHKAKTYPVLWGDYGSLLDASVGYGPMSHV